MAFHNEITDFFGRYVDAFSRENAEALSELWDEVALFPTPHRQLRHAPICISRPLRHAVQFLSSAGCRAAGRHPPVRLRAVPGRCSGPHGLSHDGCRRRSGGRVGACLCPTAHRRLARVADHSRWRNGSLEGQRSSALIEYYALPKC